MVTCTPTVAWNGLSCRAGHAVVFTLALNYAVGCKPGSVRVYLVFSICEIDTAAVPNAGVALRFRQ
jgi:hypothetical protein